MQTAAVGGAARSSLVDPELLSERVDVLPSSFQGFLKRVSCGKIELNKQLVTVEYFYGLESVGGECYFIHPTICPPCCVALLSHGSVDYYTVSQTHTSYRPNISL